ncbi:MAG: hypothetical protein LW650_11865 [Planctomycetaceae bacterium]|nr:hypothetical protein [Phycisphaerales bacterium]MCE2654124.1 hypothetical protein [Planctomycetaceae bacterium]
MKQLQASTTRSMRARGRARARRGSTLLEVVLAAFLLSGVAAAVVGVLGTVQRSEQLRRERLAAYEVANRLILQYIDDADRMPERGLPIEYDNRRFLWELDLLPLKISAPPDSVMEGNEGWAGFDGTVEALKYMSVRVWATEGDPGNPTRGGQLAQLTRLYFEYPLYSPNPDVQRRWLANPANRDRMIQAMLRGAANRPSGTPAGGTGGGTKGGGGKGGGKEGSK